jgi:sugar lactone lactonase YvrE
MKLVNDLDLDGDIIYFIDSSYEREVNEAIEEHLEALPRGRLFSFNERTNKLELLLENLYFPNGLQLTPNKDALLINENSMARILK